MVAIRFINAVYIALLPLTTQGWHGLTRRLFTSFLTPLGLAVPFPVPGIDSAGHYLVDVGSSHV